LILEKYQNLNEAIYDRFALVTKIGTALNLSKKWLSKLSEYDWHSLDSKIITLEKNLIDQNISILYFEMLNENLKLSNDFPIIFYYQGNSKILEQNRNLSIVGSRQILNYTNKILENVLGGISGIEINIVSGLAQGVDALAYKLALDLNLKCLAFVGSGLDNDNFYPLVNQKLKDQIVENGGLICSEYPPGFRATNFSFPLRNRFIAAVSDLTWVVQAGEKSGSLITAKLALEYGKTVATTPASILDGQFDGNLKLLKEGAQIISESQDVFDLMGLNIAKPKIQKSKSALKDVDLTQRSLNVRLILQNLNYEPKSIQELVNTTKIPISVLNTELSLLELEGLIQNLDQAGWVRN